MGLRWSLAGARLYPSLCIRSTCPPPSWSWPCPRPHLACHLMLKRTNATLREYVPLARSFLLLQVLRCGTAKGSQVWNCCRCEVLDSCSCLGTPLLQMCRYSTAADVQVLNFCRCAGTRLLQMCRYSTAADVQVLDCCRYWLLQVCRYSTAAGRIGIIVTH